MFGRPDLVGSLCIIFARAQANSTLLNKTENESDPLMTCIYKAKTYLGHLRFKITL